LYRDSACQAGLAKSTGDRMIKTNNSNKKLVVNKKSSLFLDGVGWIWVFIEFGRWGAGVQRLMGDTFILL